MSARPRWGKAPEATLGGFPPPREPFPAIHPEHCSHAMSGWDAEQVSFSRDVRVNTQDSLAPEIIDRNQATRQFREFIRGYRDEHGSFIYRCVWAARSREGRRKGRNGWSCIR